jgi:hypothetical protein
MRKAHRSISDVIDAPDLKSPTNPKSGRASWDERGNSIWEWQTGPGVYSRELTAEQLQLLEASHLRIVEFPTRRSLAHDPVRRKAPLQLPE